MPEARLYLLSESEFDDAFLRVIVIRVTGWDIPCDHTRHACHHYSFTGINDDDESELGGFFSPCVPRPAPLAETPWCF